MSRHRTIRGFASVPGVTCTAGRETYSAAWVGLGGFHENASALEQIGTNADCSRAGTAVYSAWYELVPAGPVNLTLDVHAGDQMIASVTVKAKHVTLRIRDLSTGSSISKTKRVSKLDVSSADWSLTAIELQQGAGIASRGPGAFRDASARAVTSAAPSAASSANGSFAVSWHEQSIQVEPRTVPTFPGFHGGTP